MTCPDADDITNPLQECVLWGVNGSQLIGGVVVILLGILARPCMWVFFGLVRTILVLVGRDAWYDSSSTAVERGVDRMFGWTVEMFRFGMFWLSIVVMVVPISEAAWGQFVFRIISIPFCFFWIMWTNLFVQVVSSIVQYQTLIAGNISTATLRATVSPMTTSPSEHQVEERSRHVLGRTYAVAQIFTLVRYIFVFSVFVAVLGVQGVNAISFMQVSTVYFLGIILAMIPIGRDLYVGALSMFVFDRKHTYNAGDELRGAWRTSFTGDYNEVKKDSVVVRRSSLLGVHADTLQNEIVMIPSSFIGDIGAEALDLDTARVTICSHVRIRQKFSTPALQKTMRRIQNYIDDLHPDLQPDYSDLALGERSRNAANAGLPSTSSFVLVKSTQLGVSLEVYASVKLSNSRGLAGEMELIVRRALKDSVVEFGDASLRCLPSVALDIAPVYVLPPRTRWTLIWA